MPELYTQDDLKKEIYFSRCRAALNELDVPGRVIEQFEKLPWPMMFQFTHLCVNAEWPWRSALKFCNENKQAILNHGASLEQGVGQSPS